MLADVILASGTAFILVCAGIAILYATISERRQK